jgi:stage V sporulation protein B
VTDKPAAGSAGRGVLWTGAGKLYFVIVGTVMQLALPRVLDRATFGAYSLVNNVTSLFNNVMVTGTIQTVSKSVAQEPDKVRRVQAAGLRMHLVLGLPIAIAFIALAPVISWLFHDDEKTAPLMLAGLIVGGYSFYAVFVGTANGLKQFHKQGAFDIMFATLRAAGVIGMAILGFKVVGVIGGWVGAVGAILVIAVAWVGPPGKVEPMPIKPMLKFFAGVGGYLILNNALLFVDTFLLKRIITEYFINHAGALAAASQAAAGDAHGSTDPAVLADVQVAYYAAVQNIGRVPYQLILAVAFVVFPMMSKATFDGDREATKNYVRVTVRYSLIFAALIAVVLAALPDGMLGLIYAPDYVEHGAPEMAPIAMGQVALAVIAIACTMLNAAEKNLSAIIVAGATLLLAAVGDYIAIPLAGDTDGALQLAAYVTGSAMVVGAGIAAIMVMREFGAFLPPLSLIRILLAIAAGIAVGRYVAPHGKLLTLGFAVIVAVVYLVVLVVTRELGRGDVAAIKAVRRRT